MTPFPDAGDPLIRGVVSMDIAAREITFGIRGLRPEFAADVIARLATIAVGVLSDLRSCNCCSERCRVGADADFSGAEAALAQAAVAMRANDERSARATAPVSSLLSGA